jgi:hypothetical protein
MQAVLEKEYESYCVACRSTKENSFCGADFVSPYPFCGHFALHELLVGQKVDAISGRLAQQCNGLAFIQTSKTISVENLLDGISRALVLRLRGRLSLKAYSRSNSQRLDIYRTTGTYGYECARQDPRRCYLRDQRRHLRQPIVVPSEGPRWGPQRPSRG